MSITENYLYDEIFCTIIYFLIILFGLQIILYVVNNNIRNKI